MVDYMAMESLEHLGIEGARDSAVKVATCQPRHGQVCLYLQEHPESLRITDRTRRLVPVDPRLRLPGGSRPAGAWISLAIRSGSGSTRSPVEDGAVDASRRSPRSGRALQRTVVNAGYTLGTARRR